MTDPVSAGSRIIIMTALSRFTLSMVEHDHDPSNPSPLSPVWTFSHRGRAGAPPRVGSAWGVSSAAPGRPLPRAPHGPACGGSCVVVGITGDINSRFVVLRSRSRLAGVNRAEAKTGLSFPPGSSRRLVHSDVTLVAAPRSTLSARTTVDGPAGPQPHVPCPHLIRHRDRRPYRHDERNAVWHHSPGALSKESWDQLMPRNFPTLLSAGSMSTETPTVKLAPCWPTILLSSHAGIFIPALPR